MEKKRRLLAIIMAAFMVITMIPSMVFATPSGEMGGKLKVYGYPVVGATLKADFAEATPEGITDGDVSFKWSRKISEEELKELGTEKEYKVTEEDLGYKLVLEVTGKEDLGLTGTLQAVTPEVTATEEEAEALVDAETAEKGESAITPPAAEEPVDDVLTEEVPEEEEWNEEEIPEGELQTEVAPGENTQSSEEEFEGELLEGGDESTDGEELDVTISEELNGDDSGQTQELTYQAEAVTGTENGIINLGTVTPGKESDSAAVLVIRNTGTGVLNFQPVAPEHVMAKDIEEPLQPQQEIEIWVQPREGLEAGEYLDTVTYKTDEGTEVSFQVQMTVDAVKASVYGLTADMDAVTFDNLTEGYQEVAGSWTVTLTNSGEDTFTLKVPQSKTFEITQIIPEGTEGSLVLEKGAQVSFNIRPVIGLTEGTYKEELVFGIEESADITRIVNADVTVTAPEEKIAVELNPQSVSFDSLKEGYEKVEPVTVSITNKGNVTIALAQPVAEYFDLGAVSAEELAPGETATFTAVPAAGLTAGEYQEKIQIFRKDNTETALAEIPAVIKVSQKEVHKLTISPAVLDFGEVEAGYKAPEKQLVTLTNEGNTQVTIEKPVSDYFRIGNPSMEVLEPGEKCTIAIRPKEGLEASTYVETIFIPNSASSDVSVDVEFTVNAAAIELLEVQKPSAVKDVKNGAEKSAKGLGLPSTVTITTTEGKMKAKVKWNVEDCAYDRSLKEAQNFTVKGKISLPEGVSNPNEVSLSTSVKVSVKAAYVPKIPDPSNNKITGISSEGYTTQSKISFEAFGAGMENTSPRAGDVRYEPQKWKVINTNSWQGAPYSATFGITKAGNYTLKVLFERQKYNGEDWVAEGENDTKQVNFSIAQGETVTPTPSAQQKNPDKKSAVETGDTTAIMPFVIILIVAVICIAGVVVYKKKKK
ncbi:MAG: choice-of-anchor D domain-containing protein [Blautia sp.]|nr:choice-of-anchor D domain-containing protein [Blautia sp.]